MVLFKIRQIKPHPRSQNFLVPEPEEDNITETFYGPSTGCIELGKLGYTLNGYYLLNGSEISNQVEVVLCQFKLTGNDESMFKYKLNKRKLQNKHFCINLDDKEERLGIISLDQSGANMSENEKKRGGKVDLYGCFPLG